MSLLKKEVREKQNIINDKDRELEMTKT